MTKAIVLVIDDSATEAKSVTKILEGASYSVEWVNDAAKGIVRAETLRPDVILMDVVMPGMNGFQATRRITKNPHTKDIPIIMLTTKDQQTDKIWAMRQGASDYLVKPANKKELLAKIIELLG